MKRISIIIVTYNSKRLIYDCLNSIFKYNDIGDALDVIISDNASSDRDDVLRIVNEEFEDKPIKILDTGGNWGYGKGNNYGIKHTDADVVIVMNPDVRFVKPVFNEILKAFNNPKLGMAGVSFVDGSLPYYFKPEFCSLFNSLFERWVVKWKKYDPTRMFLSGSLLIFDRQTFIDSGMFDENIFMYFEEADITNRVLRMKKGVKWLNNVSVLHLTHGREYNGKLKEIWCNSLEYYCSKYGLDPYKYYGVMKSVLKTKICFAKLSNDKKHEDFFVKTLNCVEGRLGKTNNP